MNEAPSTQPNESREKASIPFGVRVGAIIGVLVIGGVILFGIVPSIVSQRKESIQNLKDIGLALHIYHDVYGRFPLIHMDDENGTPRSSWRTALLPFLEESELYEKYDQNEMWNSDKNLALANETPSVFRSYFSDCSDGRTPFVAIVGEKTVFPDDRNVAFRDITDGASNTILFIADYENPVKWSEPVDVTLDEFLERYADRSDAVLHVVMADGGLLELHEVSASTLKRLAERNDGQVIPQLQ